MREVLARLESALAAAGDPLAGVWAPPLEAAVVEGHEGLPGRLPGEVVEWFCWHDGLVAGRDADYELVPALVPVSLAEAVELAVQWAAVAEQAAGEAGLDPGELWDARWLPLFMNDGGDVLVVVCDEAHREGSPLYYRLWDGGDEVVLAYDSLRGLVGTAAECWASGAYRRGEHGAVGDGPGSVTEVWARWNPVAAEAAGGVAPMGVSSGEEPVGEGDASGLLRRLGDPDPMERLGAVMDLAELGHEAALEPGLAFLRDPNAAVRWTAAQALASLADVRAAGGLRATLSDPVAEVRWNAAGALGKLGQGVPAEARAALEAAARHDQDETVRRVAQRALDEVGGA